jgi:hypothetical protein
VFRTSGTATGKSDQEQELTKLPLHRRDTAKLKQEIGSLKGKHEDLKGKLTAKFERVLEYQRENAQTREEHVDEITVTLHKLMQADYATKREIKLLKQKIRKHEAETKTDRVKIEALNKQIKELNILLRNEERRNVELAERMSEGVTDALCKQQQELQDEHRRNQMKLKRALNKDVEDRSAKEVKRAREKQAQAHKRAIKMLKLPVITTTDCRSSYVHGDNHGHVGWKNTFANILRTSLNTDEQYRAVVNALKEDLEEEDELAANLEEKDELKNGVASNSDWCSSYRARTRIDELMGEAKKSRALIGDYLKSDLAAVMDLLPERHITAIKKIGAEKIAKSLAAHWTADRCLYIKQTCRLSNVKYNLLRDALTKGLDPITGRSVPLVIDGTLIHPIASKYACTKRFQQICEEYGLQESVDGKVAWVNVEKKIRMDIEEHIRMGHLKISQDGNEEWVVTGLDDKPIVFCFSFDAANFHKGMKQTSFGYKIANLINAAANSPHVFHEFALMEGKDNHEAILEHVGEIIEQVHAIILTGSIAISVPRAAQDIISVAFNTEDVVACCDLVAGRSNFGQSGCNAKKPCFFCDCAKEDLCRPDIFDDKKLKKATGDKFDDKICNLINRFNSKFTSRDIETSNLLAHVELGTCPACRLEIVDEITDPESQILRAQPGDKPPPVPEQYNGTSWSVLHSCQNYGEKVLFRIPVTQWAVCILHMNLRITGMMFERTVLRNLMKDPRSKSKTDAKTSSSNSRASHLYDLLLALRIPCKLFSCPKNSVGKFYNSISKHSFAGNDSAKCISAYESILKVAFPSSAWDPNHADYNHESDDTKRYNRAVAVWKQWAEEVWPLINNLELAKEDKATKLEVEGKKFMRLWVAAAGEHTSHVYPHILVAHLPNQIRDLPMDPWYFQTQCLEHKHKFRKLDSFVTNHHAPKDLEERKSDVNGYYRAGKWVHGKKGRRGGPARNYQMLGKSVVNDHYRNYMSTAAANASKWERGRLARERRNQLQCNQLLESNATAQNTLGGIVRERQDAEAARHLAEAVDCDDEDESSEEEELVNMSDEDDSDDEELMYQNKFQICRF